MAVSINVKARAKKARQLDRYRRWKESGISTAWQHFEIWAAYPPKKAGGPCRLRRVRRQLAMNGVEALEKSQKGLALTLERGAQLFVLERFDQSKQQQLDVLRTLLR